MSRLELSFAMVAPVLAAGLALAPSTALANGRRQTAMNVYFDPSDAQRVIAGVTFGMLVSRDGGESFHWVCEEAACPPPEPGGLNGCDTFDPDVEITADGDVFLTSIYGLHVSRDGCVYEPVGGPLADRFIADIELGSDQRLWAITGDGAQANHVWASTDGGRGFDARNRTIEGGVWDAINTAPSDPDRVYLSGFIFGTARPDAGFGPNQGVLYRSDDGGDSWVALTATGLPPELRLNLPLVSPTDPDTLFVYVRGADLVTGTVYRSTDGGASFQAVLSLPLTSPNLSDPAASISLAVRANGSFVAGSPDGGLWLSTDGGAMWSRAPVETMTWCVNESPGGELFACSENWDPAMLLDPSVRFALGKTTDARTWTQVMRFSGIAGPLDCPAGTAQDTVCEQQRWCGLAEILGIDSPLCAPGGGADTGIVEPGDDAGCGSCGGCSVGLAAALFVLPPRKRRRTTPVARR